MVVMNDKLSNSQCPECPEKRILGEYVSGRLEEPQLGQCEAHLAHCDQCEETVRGMFGSDTANDSFSGLAVEALKNEDASFSGDAPLVDQLIRDLSGKTPDSDRDARALENRAAEVTRLLPASESDGAVGQVGGYQIIRLLGAGSTGIVYEATDQDLNRKVALKILRPSLGDAARDRFMNEARAAAAISHPNVITIYQVGVEGPLAFIAMELTEGQTLESRLNEVAFVPQDDIKKIGTQVAQGLAAAHRNGLIHRDIKPANVWLKSENDQAVILDFGLARIADDDPQMTATGMLAGTPNFMSPEQTRGLELDGRSDLFSLGCLMYRASTGKLPFGTTGILATLQSIQHDDPRAPKLLNPHVSDDFSDLVMALLEKQPVNRPETADQLVKALQSERKQWPFAVSMYGERDIGSSTRPALPVTETAARSKRFGGWRWVTAALLLIGLGGLGWFFAPQIVRIATDRGELVIDAKDEAVEVEVMNGGQRVRVIDTKTDQSIEIESGEYDLRLKDSTNGFHLSTNRVVLTRGDQEVVSIVRTADGDSANGSLGSELMYAGKTFNEWMQVVKTDRQLKAKFGALVAVAELAQGNEDLKKQVMDQIKPLLRKYGSNVMTGGDPFLTDLGNGAHSSNTLRNSFANEELTHLFIEILRRFPADDLVDLAIDEIKNGSANSREFVRLLWYAGSMWQQDPQGQLKQFRAIDEHAVEIVTAALESAESCDERSRKLLIESVGQVANVAARDWDSEEDPLNQFYSNQFFSNWFHFNRGYSNSEQLMNLEYSNQGYSNQLQKAAAKIPAQLKALLNSAYESGQPLKRALVAVAMVRAFPNRANLAIDFAKLLADEQVSPELRLAGLNALEKLPIETIRSVAGQLLAAGKQSENANDRLKAWIEKHRTFYDYHPNVDVRIALLLSKLADPPQGFLSWLKELQAKAEADPGRARIGDPDQLVEKTKRWLVQARVAVDPDYEPPKPKPREGGVF